MDESIVTLGKVAADSKQLARRFVTIGENRLELLAVEIQEETARVLRAFLLALAVATFGLFTGLTLTAALVVALWSWSPVAVLLILSALYGAAAVGVYRELSRLLKNWQTLAATLDQLRKDRLCLEDLLA